jgi:hypothetical protein
LISKLLLTGVSGISGLSGQNSKVTLSLTFPFCQPLFIELRISQSSPLLNHVLHSPDISPLCELRGLLHSPKGCGIWRMMSTVYFPFFNKSTLLFKGVGGSVAA